jgi:hypothetical protein
MAGRSEKWFAIAARLGLVVLFTLGSSGCVSKSKADSQARLAYLAGQRDALMQLQAQPHPGPTVTFIGPVNNHIVDWSAGLTLSQAIVKAVYAAASDPASIVIHRSGQDIQTNPGQLLEGKDLPLQPGDVVEIH